MSETVAVVVYCPRCDYFLKIALPPDAIGTHGCAQCGGQMEVYVARRGADHQHDAAPSDPGSSRPADDTRRADG